MPPFNFHEVMIPGVKRKICSILFSVCFLFFISQVKCEDEFQKDITPEDYSQTAETLFRRLYKLERTEQLAAVKALMKLATEDKQSQMIEAIAEKVFSVIHKSKLILEDAGYTPGKSSFPRDERIRDALSNILENTAFLGDIIVRLPHLTNKVLKKNSDWNILMQWSLIFTNQSQLVDLKTSTLLNLVNQELNYTERSSDFINPYSKIRHSPASNETQKKKEKKKKIPKGPRLSLRQIGEL